MSFVELERHRGWMVYREAGRSLRINADDECGDSFALIIEDMGAIDPFVQSLSSEDRIRIAENIRQHLQSQGVLVDIIYEHRYLPIAKAPGS